MPDYKTGLYTREEMEKIIIEYQHRMMRESGMFLECPYCGENVAKKE